MVKGNLTSIADTVGAFGADNVVLGFFLLEHEPHGFDVFFGVTPVAHSIKVAKVEFVIGSNKQVPKFVDGDVFGFVSDDGSPCCDFAGDEVESTAWAFVVKQNTCASKHIV